MKYAPALAALLAPAVVASVASADSADQATGTLQTLRTLAPMGPFTPAPGEWVVYRIGEGGTAAYLGVAYLGASASDPKGSGWLQMTYGDRPEGGLVAFKMLMEGDPRHPRQIHKIFMRLGGGTSFELPEAKVSRVKRDADREVTPAPTPTLGPAEYVQVTGGSFQAHRLDTPLGAIWVSDTAPLFHLVSGQFKGTRFELFASGKEARDVVGTPTVKLALTPDGGMITVEDGGSAAGARP